MYRNSKIENETVSLIGSNSPFLPEVNERLNRIYSRIEAFNQNSRSRLNGIIEYCEPEVRGSSDVSKKDAYGTTIAESTKQSLDYIEEQLCHLETIYNHIAKLG